MKLCAWEGGVATGFYDWPDNFYTVIDTFKNHYDTILNFFVNTATNANAESFNAKAKAFRAQFRGVADIPFFLYRLMKLCAWGERVATGFYDWPIMPNIKEKSLQGFSVLKASIWKKAATYSPALHCSTIGASRLNFSVRNGKRWNPAAITTW